MRGAGRTCTEAPNGEALATGQDAKPRAPRAPRVPKTDIQKEALDAAFRSATPLWLLGSALVMSRVYRAGRHVYSRAIAALREVASKPRVLYT